MNNEIHDMLVARGDFRVLDRRLQFAPQPQVLKPPNQNYGWAIIFSDGEREGMWRAPTWEKAVAFAIEIHKESWKRRHFPCE